MHSFAPTTEDEVTALVRRAPPKSCELDPIPTWLLKQSAPQLVPAITTIINTFLSTSTVPITFKRAILRPLLKKRGLETSEYKNFQPVSSLPFISKIMEKVVCKRIFDDLYDPHWWHCKKTWNWSARLCWWYSALCAIPSKWRTSCCLQKDGGVHLWAEAVDYGWPCVA
jgi:hypothetical protein